VKLFLISISLLLCSAASAQDVSLGVNIGTNPYNRLKVNSSSDWFKPENSFAIYQTENPGSGVIIDEHKFFNTVHFGASLRLTRKKIGVNFEPQLLFEYMAFTFNTQFPNFHRVLSRKGLRLPVYATYHLFNNPMSVHFNAGFIFQSMEVNDYQRPETDFYATELEAFSSYVDYGDDHFNEVFYSRKGANINYMLGIGKRINNLDYNLRYVSAIDQSKLTGTRWQIELHINYFFLSQNDFLSKKYLYEE